MKYSLSRFTVGSQHIRGARRALERFVAATQKHDPGVVYLVFRDPQQPVFFGLVSFRDEEHFRRHATSAHAARFARTILPMCTGKPSFVGLDLLAAASPLAPAAALPLSPSRPARSMSIRVRTPRRRRN